jgi:hypothetical protein
LGEECREIVEEEVLELRGRPRAFHEPEIVTRQLR